MATEYTPQRSWLSVLRFYDSFRDHDWWAWLGPFRRLVVARLAESEWGRRLWASQSHEMLVISCVGTWPERAERPGVFVMPLKTTAQIRCYRPAGDQLGEVELPFDQCWPAIEDALAWLEAADAELGATTNPA